MFHSRVYIAVLFYLQAIPGLCREADSRHLPTAPKCEKDEGCATDMQTDSLLQHGREKQWTLQDAQEETDVVQHPGSDYGSGSRHGRDMGYGSDGPPDCIANQTYADGDEIKSREPEQSDCDALESLNLSSCGSDTVAELTKFLEYLCEHEYGNGTYGNGTYGNGTYGQHPGSDYGSGSWHGSDMGYGSGKGKGKGKDGPDGPPDCIANQTYADGDEIKSREPEQSDCDALESLNLSSCGSDTVAELTKFLEYLCEHEYGNGTYGNGTYGNGTYGYADDYGSGSGA